MLNVLLLSKLLALRCWITGATRKNRAQSKISLGGFALLMIVALGSLGVLFYHIFETVALPFHAANLDWLYFTFSAVFSFALMFIGCVFTAKAQLFDARDNDLLLALPLKSSDILISRLFMLAVIDLVLGLLVMIPAGFVWARFVSFSGIGLAAYVLSLLLIILFALALSAFFGWIIHRLTLKLPGNKTLITTLLSLLLCGGYLYINFNMNNLLIRLAADPSGAAEFFRPLLPLYWLGAAAANGDLTCLLLSLILPAAAFGLMFFLLSRDFLHAATGTPLGQKQTYVERSVAAVSPSKALLRREVARFFSCSAFILNAALGSIFAPIAAIVLLIKRAALLQLLETVPGAAVLAPALLLLGVCLTASMTIITAPAVSLEGKSFYLARSLPCPTKELLKAKLKLHCLIGMPALFPLSLAAVYVSRPSVFLAGMIILIPEALILLTGLTGLYYGVRFPNLDWTNETQAVKSSMGALAAIGIGMAVPALPVIAFLLLGDAISIEGLIGLFAVTVLLLDIVFWYLVMTTGVKLYEEL